METMNTNKKNLGKRWIKSDSGETWICPIDVAKNADSLSDDELRELCVNESENPENA